MYRIPPQIPVVFLSKVDKSTKERSKNKIDHDLESVDLFIPLHQSLPLSTSSLLPGVPNTEKKEHEYPVLKKFKTEILETAHVSMMYAQHIYIPPSTLETIIETDEEMNNSSSIGNYNNSIILLLIIKIIVNMHVIIMEEVIKYYK